MEKDIVYGVSGEPKDPQSPKNDDIVTTDGQYGFAVMQMMAQSEQK